MGISLPLLGNRVHLYGSNVPRHFTSIVEMIWEQGTECRTLFTPNALANIRLPPEQAQNGKSKRQWFRTNITLTNPAFFSPNSAIQASENGKNLHSPPLVVLSRQTALSPYSKPRGSPHLWRTAIINQQVPTFFYWPLDFVILTVFLWDRICHVSNEFLKFVKSLPWKSAIC